MTDLKEIDYFSYEKFESLVDKFSIDMPKFLLRHQSTAPLALALEQLHLPETLKTRFTVAIIGQMRVGKSTLLNALIGDDLAPTGVTETTATINWFRYDEGGDLSNKFRVNWTDGSSSILPIEKANEWIGTAENAVKTRSLDFFANTDFLRTANVVDTPGTRSIIGSHEGTIQAFLLEEATLKYGGSADAVIYAINPVGRESDRDLLNLFGERTRLPGASAFNSIAVVQKWEHLQPDPIAAVQKKCQILRDQLEGKVATVIPTSGLIAQHVRQVPHQVWQKLVDLCSESTEEALDLLLLSEQDFTDEYRGAGLDRAARRDLLHEISWRIIPLCVGLIRQHRITEGEILRASLHTASGIPLLRDLLQKQFFSRSRLIKVSTTLRKAWEPCNIALQMLHQENESLSVLLKNGNDALKMISTCNPPELNTQGITTYIKTSLNILESNMATIKDIGSVVDDLKYKVQKNFELLDADIDTMNTLMTESSSFTPKESYTLNCLFGMHGPDLWSRLGLDPVQKNFAEAVTKAQDQHSYWSLQNQRSFGKKKSICSHACNVLDLILDHLGI